MKTILTLLVTVLSATSALAVEPTIRVRTQLCELPAETAIPDDLSKVSKLPGADNYVAPENRTHSGQPVKVAITRNYAVPGKGTVPIGPELSIQPTLVGHHFNYSVDFKNTEVDSLAARSATPVPVLSTREIVGMNGRCASGEPIWLDLGTREIKVVERTLGIPTRTLFYHKRFIAILTFSKA